MNIQNLRLPTPFGLQICGVELDRFIEGLGALTCLWSVWLNTRGKTMGWPIGLISVLLAAWIYFKAGLLAECGLQGFYFVSGIYGWRQWSASAKSASEVRITVDKLSVREAIGGMLIALISSVLIFMLLRQLSQSVNPVPDALITGFSLLAQFWMARRKLENWLLWTIINTGSVLLYLQQELWFFAVLYTVLLVLAIKAFLEWRKQLSPC
jgi:nicotinamide mononucleotide transporter